MRIADSLFGSKGPTKYDVVEIKTTSEGEYKKRSKCVKGKHLDAWFREKTNQDSCKLPEIAEDQLDTVIGLIMETLMDRKLMHTARKPDNAKRIFTENINVWNKKYVYSWDYDGPAGMRYLKIAITIAALIAIPTYRIWPVFLQRIVMRTTLAITIGLIALEIVRFLLFLVCRLFGYSIWIFPDLDRDDKGLFGVFYPLISVEKLNDGRNKYRYTILAILVALISIFLYNPQQAIRTTKTVINTTSSSVQWIAAVEYVKQFSTPKVRIETNERKAPAYNPEDDEVYDFDEADVVDEEDLVDLDDLEDVKLDIELGV
ncbi:hypothetical protein JH06_2732 [Blastocystis sp. subtype 4]|uniref:hypothetical protein n=1 Tax=Blastocystis sp. subtype 4 TaxID=944170 RepID=UPI000711F38B|nr:hypothetical protein JH06_2732 [Blastocystis sp. subtype 4]KNB43430.1 hypothetical protein JH06_2732 [Blastocystis sp. subtype 4]|eukprot:XP_014526873.1 hypothetical protein JH06_2732 [Blastocystis sp. subtype 4]